MLSRDSTLEARYTKNCRAGFHAGVRWILADLVSRALSESVGSSGPPLDGGPWAVRLSVPVGVVDPLEWLRVQRPGSRLYWSGREDGLEVAAAGVADLQEGLVSETPTALRKRLAPLLRSSETPVRYYGGLRFDPEGEVSEEWESFGGYRFVLPRFELWRRDGRSTLVCNLVMPRDADRRGEILDQIETLPLAEGVPGIEGVLPVPVSRLDSPGRRGWRENVERALAAFSEGRMDKMVLARRAELRFEGVPDPILMVTSLKAATPGCFHFYVEPEEGAAFLGASPERLFRREGRDILSEAVAGTRPRGASEADDEELREELLRSVKDEAEHSYVRVSIGESLEPLCQEIEVEYRPSEMKLARSRHLVSKVRGTLREGVTDAEVLCALHPTPAVGGYPKREAIEEIRALEPFDRGWYAGPVGWIGTDGAEFAVGIRSGLVRRDRLALFSGAGIVSASTPESEWAEIEQKITDFSRVFGVEPAEHTAT